MSWKREFCEKSEMGNGGCSLPFTMFCLMTDKTFDNPFRLIPGQMYLVAYMRIGLEPHDGQ